MFLNNILIAIETIGEIKNVIELDWLGKIIQALIEGCGSIGLGVIVFTLILKLITLPFDIISRVSTKKSGIMMEKMRPELEKLQRQYANNKDLYQRKMQDLYKKNGYSPFSACLPTLLNLVFFIVVIGQFSTYSNYANFGVFCDMSVAYEQAITQHYQVEGEENEDKYIIVTTENGVVNRNLDSEKFYNSTHGEYLRSFNLDQSGSGADFTLNYGDSTSLKALYEEIAKGESGALSDFTPAEGENGVIILDGEVYKLNDELVTAVAELKATAGGKLLEYYGQKFIDEYIKESGRQAAAETFRNTELSFLWVKNVWSQDLPWQHPVKEDFSEYGFVKKSGCFDTCSASCNGEDNTIKTVTELQYDELTAGLQEEKSQPNGYLILVVLSIGTMLLSQFVMSKQNKTQNELSSVDGENGSAAQSQKMMMWMMPIMFGFFSFMYTASFSIYIVLSSVFSLVANLIINKCVELKFERLAKIEAENLELKRTGRIKELEERQNKSKKKNKK